MTWSDKVKSIAEILSAAWRWVALAAAVLALLFLVRACNRVDRAEDEVERVKEAAQLERAGFLVAERVKDSELKAAVAKVPALQAEIDRLAKELDKKPKVVTVERIVTAPAPAEGVPRPDPTPGEPCPDCLFAAGDTGEIRVDSAHLETAKGNEVVALSAECWRLTPEPSTRILSGVGSAPVSSLLVETPAEEPGWGWGLLAGYGTSGAVGTFQGFTPPLLWRLSLTGAVTAGREEFQLQGGIVYQP
jgi:hypothetical protein